ncbi:MAG: phage tail tape measure protein [Fusobacteriaceae bacterium]
MADYTLSAVFKLKDSFSSAANKINGKAQELKSSFNSTETKLGSFRGAVQRNSEDIGKAFKIMGGVAVTGIVAIGAAAWSTFKEYAELNQVLTKNAALLGASKEESRKLEEQVKNLGATTAFTAKEVAQAQKYQIMAGYDLNKVLETTPKLLKLSIVAEQDLARTSDLVTDTMDALGLKTKDLGRYLDIVSNVSNKSNTSVSGLMEAFLGGASTGVSFGDSIEDVSTLLGILANNGTKAGQAGTFLNAVYANFAASSQTNMQMLKENAKHGISFYGEDKKFKGMTKILEELRPKLAKMTEAQRNQYLAIMIGKEHLSTFLKVLNATPESIRNMEDAANNSSGSLEKVYGQLKDTPLQKIKELESAYEGLRLKFGEAVTPTMLVYMKELTDYISNLKTDDIKTFVDNAVFIFNGLNSTLKAAITTAKILADVWSKSLKIGTALINTTSDVASFGVTSYKRGKKIEEINKNTDFLGQERMNLNAATMSPYELDDILKQKQTEVVKNNYNKNISNINNTTPANDKNNLGPRKPVEIKIDMSNMKIDGGVTKEDVTNIFNNAVGKWELSLTDNLNLGGAY